jgi:hypothetical protein
MKGSEIEAMFNPVERGVWRGAAAWPGGSTMQAPRKIRASNHRPEPGGLSRYLPDAAALNKPFREYAIAAKIGCTPQTLRDWVRKAEVDSGQRVVGRLACHGSILSGVGASGKPGAVQSEVPNFVAVSRSPTSVDGPIAPGRGRFRAPTILYRNERVADGGVLGVEHLNVPACLRNHFMSPCGP